MSTPTPGAAKRRGEAILEVEDLRLYYPIRGGLLQRPVAWLKAVDGVSMSVNAGEVLGVVGESGCGKTSLVNAILQLEKLTGGRVFFAGKEISRMKGRALRAVRADLQVVFQDPFWSLNPRLLIRDIIGEPLKVHKRMTGARLLERVQQVLQMVDMPPEAAYRYPHEFSGGVRQRIAIARALVLEPRMVILDEPTSAIDMVSQVQILTLVRKLKEEMQLTYILVSHDLSVVHFLSTVIMVMYLGKVVEFGPSATIFSTPLHPYTQALFAAIPNPEVEGIGAITPLEGTVPSAVNPPPGCTFHTRCPRAEERCRREEPVLMWKDGRQHACLLVGSDGGFSGGAGASSRDPQPLLLARPPGK